MKYIFFIILSALFTACSSNKEQVAEIIFFPGTKVESGLYYKINSDSLFSGTTESTYSDGSPYVTASFKDGKFHGTYSAWYSNGQKMGETEYINGKKDGIATAWHDNGNKASVVHFVENKKEGQLNLYYFTGELKAKGYFKNDLLDSTYTRWDLDGNIISTEVYEDGLLVRKGE